LDFVTNAAAIAVIPSLTAGFSDLNFAYCDHCGTTLLIDAWSKDVPAGAQLRGSGVISWYAERLLEACKCGGAFRRSSEPRCPHCKKPLSAGAAAEYLEAHAPGAAKGWRWSQTWHGIYAIVIEGRVGQPRW